MKSNRSQVEICEDMSCIIFNETGYEIASVINQVVGKKSGCILTEKTYTPTNYRYYDLEIGSISFGDCDKF